MFWALPFALHSADALAWGLYTHVYFAQLLIWVTPLADTRFRRAVRRFPELLLAGACLPDISLFSHGNGSGALGVTHQWSIVRSMLQSAQDDAERAIATGFASHLLTDIIAHNHFVPAHEELWLKVPLATHAASEWAMDAHVAPQLFARPATIIARNLDALVRYGTRHFGCTGAQTRQALRYLQHGEHLLRLSRLPQAAFHGACLMDARVRQRFDYYACETTLRLAQISRVLSGDVPVWQPEVDCAETARLQIRNCTPRQLRYRLPLPRDFFQGTCRQPEQLVQADLKLRSTKIW
jgi:hypothetical protein